MSVAVALLCAILAGPAQALQLASGAEMPQDAVVATQVFFSYQYLDNIVAGTPQTAAEAEQKGYSFVDNANGYFIPQAGADLVPLLTFFSPLLNDTLTTAAAPGLAWADDSAHGYEFVRVEGYCNTGAPPPDAMVNVFVQYWGASRNDTFLVLVSSVNEENAKSAQYTQVWSECWALPLTNWTTWPDSGPEVNIPFPKSTDILGFEYLPGANANYGGADTWYPSWGADDILYSPWTDGTVNGVSSFSGGQGLTYASTTGIAVVVGSNPFNLTVEKAHTFESSSFPYHSRYPCGSLAYNGSWYYGTYFLDNPNGTTAQGDPLGPNPGPNCGNWCVQGPLVDFRVSTDGGETWMEPRMNTTGPADNLFGETAIHNSKVKFGAPHFVDFGKNMMYSPDGKAYIVGHGASRPEAVQAWQLGDEIYMARAHVADINNGSAWEFYAGGHGANAEWVRGNVSAAQPLLVWNDSMGVVTMTYHPVLHKFIMVVSTASFYPSMVKQFDTYFLESDSITGPFSYFTYLREFGPEAYFVHFPSKFLAAEIPENSSSYAAFLSYSANFAFSGTPASPPGSGYHWSLQQSRLPLSAAFLEKLKN